MAIYKPHFKLLFRSIFCVLLWALSLLHSPQILAEEESFEITRVDISGIKVTDPEWVIDYLDIEFPAKLTKKEIDIMARKLLTTAVFSKVEANLVPNISNPKEYTLEFKVEEKWTLIPVIRGAYGGGTPLQVIGMYDTHVLGRLWTLGAESRKYGSSPPGYVLWAKAPRWLDGKHVVGFELWRDRRRRDFFDDQGELYGFVNTNAAMVKGYVLFPVNDIISAERFSSNWQFGSTIQTRREYPNKLEYSEPEQTQIFPKNMILSERESTETKVLFNLVYDNIYVNNIEMDGYRFVFKEGPLFTKEDTYQHVETEGFFYLLKDSRYGHNWNLALHYLLGGSSVDTISNQFFIGGFDSVRGIPDSWLYGTHVLNINFEVRKMLMKARYMWIQTATFYDYGAAEKSWRTLFKNDASSVGLGIRLMIPQVYRLMFRIDYAWSIEKPGRQGINAGLNQLFEPYAPLSSGL